MRTISIYLRMSEHTTTEVTAQNRPKSQRSYIIRNQPVTLRIGIFRHDAAVAIMSKAELEAEGWKTWLLNISKNHTLSYPVYIQPDYDYENPPITVSEEGVISVVLNTTDTEESAKAIKGMPGDMWEAELTGFAEDDTALETPLAILQWPIGYINRVADENADAPGLLESTYYTKEQVNELLRQIAPEGTWGHIIGDITDQEDLIALLEEKANKATTLAGYGITDAYTKTEIDAKVASVYRYKGSVNAYSDLPTEDQQVGDVYNVVNADEEHGIKAGDNVAWNGEKWDVLAGEIDLSGYIQKAEKGEPNGVPTLDENGKVPMSQMPVLQLDSPPTTSTSGSVGQLAVYHDSATNKDHLYHLCFVSEGESATFYHWEECVLESARNVAGGFAGLDANGQVASAQLPVAGEGVFGIIKTNIQNGMQVTANGTLATYSATQNGINLRLNQHAPIVPLNLDYAVRSVLPNVTEIPAATSDYSLVDSSATTNNHSHVYSHAPTTAPTYRLPQVTNTTISHYIELTVDFTAVQTYSFLDHAGEPIVPLFTPAIAAGDVYTFKMEYSAIKAAWLIYPQKQGAVADDFVMRGEVGAANGVPSLDANAKVPSGQLPIATNSSLGLIKGYVNGVYGINIDANGQVRITRAEPTTDILTRTSSFKPIVPSNLNYAVTAAITDANHITLTDAQKATAQSVFGVGGPITAIPAATSAYTLAEGIFTHAPTSAPTYTLPNITDDIRTHEVVLIIDFSSVQTFSFLVDGGGDVTFQSYANPTTGDVWAFRCWWYGGKWRIAPTKIKNCVTRQLANGSLSITDAVGGDALALKMVAPRSVVVNQLVNSRTTTDWLVAGTGSTATFSDDIYTVTIETSSTTTKGYIYSPSRINYIKGHKYALYTEIRNITNTTAARLSWRNGTTAANLLNAQVEKPAQSSTWISAMAVGTITADSAYLFIGLNNNAESGASAEFRNMMCIDLTQYFNGDTTLIDSITSWDDLVAYDPRFASYVAYNTGTVEGVQPQVAVNSYVLNQMAESTAIQAQHGLNFQKQADGGLHIWGTCDYTGTYICSKNFNVRYGRKYGFCLYGADSYTNGHLMYSTSAVTRYSTVITSSGSYSYGVGIHIKSGDTVDLTVYPTMVDIGKLCHEDATKVASINTWNDLVAAYPVYASYVPYNTGTLVAVGGTAQAPAPLFAVGSAADEFEAVAGVTTRKIGVVDLGTLSWGSYYAADSSHPYGYCIGTCPGKKYGYFNLVVAGYDTYTNGLFSTDKHLSGYGSVQDVNATRLYLADSSLIGKNGTEIATALSGKLLYFELATPTTSASTPTQISLQAGNNVAMQTDGGRLAPIDITYESDEL